MYIVSIDEVKAGGERGGGGRGLGSHLGLPGTLGSVLGQFGLGCVANQVLLRLPGAARIRNTHPLDLEALHPIYYL